MDRFEPAQTPDIEQELAESAEQAGLGTAAARGVGILVGRTVVLQALTAVVTIVLARILSPSDYGLFAIALAIQLVGQRAVELGLPAALIRMPEDPPAELQRAVVTVMLAFSGSLALVAALVAFVVLPALDAADELVEVIAVALLATPFYALRARPTIAMERRLDFGRVALIETADTLVFNGFALVAAIAGLGAFSLAGAVPAGALVSLLIAIRIGTYPRGLSLDLSPIRPLIGFGLGTSLFQAIALGRELGFVALLAGIGGTGLAGYYAMAKRLFSFPIALNSAVFRVSLPTLSRGSAEQQRRRAGRMATSSAIVTALPLALVAGAAYPLVSVVLGDTWMPTVDVLLPGSIAMFLSASVVATILSFSLAGADSRVPVIGSAVEAIVLFACVILIRPLDTTAVGIALAAGAIVQTAVLLYLKRPFDAPRLLELSLILVIGVAAAAIPLLLPLPETVTGLLAALAITGAAWTVLSLLFTRAPIRALLDDAKPMVARLRPTRRAAA